MSSNSSLDIDAMREHNAKLKRGVTILTDELDDRVEKVIKLVNMDSVPDDDSPSLDWIESSPQKFPQKKGRRVKEKAPNTNSMRTRSMKKNDQRGETPQNFVEDIASHFVDDSVDRDMMSRKRPMPVDINEEVLPKQKTSKWINLHFGGEMSPQPRPKKRRGKKAVDKSNRANVSKADQKPPDDEWNIDTVTSEDEALSSPSSAVQLEVEPLDAHMEIDEIDTEETLRPASVPVVFGTSIPTITPVAVTPEMFTARSVQLEQASTGLNESHLPNGTSDDRMSPAQHVPRTDEVDETASLKPVQKVKRSQNFNSQLPQDRSAPTELIVLQDTDHADSQWSPNSMRPMGRNLPDELSQTLNASGSLLSKAVVETPIPEVKRLTRVAALALYNDEDEKQNELIGMQRSWISNTVPIKQSKSEKEKFEFFLLACQISKLPPPLPLKVFQDMDWNYVETFDTKKLAPGQKFLTLKELEEGFQRRHGRFPFCHPGPVVDTVSGTRDWFYADSVVQQVKLVTHNKPFYVVRWVGYEDKYNTVEPEQNLDGSAILELHRKRKYATAARSNGAVLLRRSVWWACDALTGYPLFGEMYTGQPSTGREVNQGERVVKTLSAKFKDTGRNIVTDNFFTTLPLAKFLSTWNLTLVGTIKKTKLTYPKKCLLISHVSRYQRDSD